MSDRGNLLRRGFEKYEFEDRINSAQKIMERDNLGCILLASEPEIYYFTGFITQFWQSPTRPWYVVLPLHGKPIAVIPSIGEELMSSCYVKEVRSWVSPSDKDDGLSLLKEALKENLQGSQKIGLMLGRETSLRMPLGDIFSLYEKFGAENFFDVTDSIQYLRMIKSPAEIEKIKYVCSRVSKVFSNFPDYLEVGISLSDVFRQFKVNCLAEGVDDVSYLVGAAGPGGYFDIIAPPNDRPLEEGDVLMLDTGTKWDGYFCDFDRNFAVGKVSHAVHKVHEILYDSIDLAVNAIKPNNVSMKDIFNEMDSFLRSNNLEKNKSSGSVGRYGHGLGIQLTERPSFISWDETIIEPGMVLTLEPSLLYGEEGFLMVAEENILVTDTGVEFLTSRWPRELKVI